MVVYFVEVAGFLLSYEWLLVLLVPDDAGLSLSLLLSLSFVSVDVVELLWLQLL